MFGGFFWDGIFVIIQASLFFRDRFIVTVFGIAVIGLRLRTLFAVLSLLLL